MNKNNKFKQIYFYKLYIFVIFYQQSICRVNNNSINKKINIISFFFLKFLFYFPTIYLFVFIKKFTKIKSVF